MSKRIPFYGRIDRSKTIHFTWDGKALQGHEGDTLASALLANNINLVGRSFKYHRPRGIMSAGVEESGALVTIGSGAYKEPNTKATTQVLYQGLAAFGQNAWPNVRWDFNAVNGLFGRWFAAGFYYKTFMGLPGGTTWWMQFEKIIRKAAGMGEASRLPDPDAYEHAHRYCDVLVVGSGPAGLSAALTAATEGLEVLLVEQDSALGGDYLNTTDPNKQTEYEQRLTAVQNAGVQSLIHTTAFGLYDGVTAGLIERVTDHLPAADDHLPRQRFWTVRAKHIILATGALERTFAFANNDLPGVMNANAGRIYLNRFGVLAGQSIVIATNNDSAYECAQDLAKVGANVTLLDSRNAVSTNQQQTMEQNDIRLHLKSTVSSAHGIRSVKSLDVIKHTGNSWSKQQRLSCDTALISGGWSPAVHLLSHRGIKPIWNQEQLCFTAPNEVKEPITLTGSASAIWRHEACVESGEQAAKAAIATLTKQSQHSVPLMSSGGWETPIDALYEAPNAKGKCFVDPQHDVTTDDIRLAHREGMVSVEHLKRYTTLGMASDGGKMGNVIGLALMAQALNKTITEVGTTTFRPPYTPIAIGALKGRNVDEHFRPLRRTALHGWNVSHGATMTIVGLWQRPWYYAQPQENLSDAYVRESTTVRNAVGLCDVTPLGKIAIQGPDATAFLNRIYTNPFAKLPIGKARYGIMLRDDGVVMDDGTTWRLSEHEYFMTTTTAQAGRVMVWLEELLQTRWQDLRVHVTSVSDQWAGCAVAGPDSRTVLAQCLASPEMVSNENLPFMGVLETQLKDGTPCRIARISFSGERAFELYVPSDYGHAMMERLWAETQLLNGCLYGVEALGTLRIEKGHVTGAELDGRTSIDDIGLGKMASPNKSFIGSSLRQRPEFLKTDRPQLVGIKPKNLADTFNAGAVLCAQDQVSGLGQGWVTAVTQSPALGHWIGLGFIQGGHEAWAEKTVIAADPVRNQHTEVEIISPHMYDPSGERMHG